MGQFLAYLAYVLNEERKGKSNVCVKKKKYVPFCVSHTHRHIYIFTYILVYFYQKKDTRGLNR